MLDLKLVSDPSTGVYDLEIAPNGDLASVNDFSTTILTSLLTDARADPDQVVTPELRRGWIGSTLDVELGSKLWLLEPARATQASMDRAVGFCRQALQFMLDQEIAAAIEIRGSITGPRQGTIEIEMTAPDGSQETQFLELWENTAFQPGGLPPPLVEAVPFTPLQVENIAVWGDAAFSDHDIDENCGVIVTRDITGTADYFQAAAASRPFRLQGSGGWFYRFDGVDDFLATPNQIFPNLNEGSLFLIYKPRAGIVANDRVFTFARNGLTDAVGGLAIRQAAADLLALVGDGGNLDVSVQGSNETGDPYGIVFRWGPSSAGADGENSIGNTAQDTAFVNEVGVPNQAIIGAGFDGVNADTSTAGIFELSAFAVWPNQIADADVLRLLDYAETRKFTSPDGDPFSDCTYFTDDKGFV